MLLRSRAAAYRHLLPSGDPSSLAPPPGIHRAVDYAGMEPRRPLSPPLPVHGHSHTAVHASAGRGCFVTVSASAECRRPPSVAPRPPLQSPLLPPLSLSPLPFFSFSLSLDLSSLSVCRVNGEMAGLVGVADEGKGRWR